MRLHLISGFAMLALFFITGCKQEIVEQTPVKQRVFEGFHPLLDEIILTKSGVFRGLDLNAKTEAILNSEKNTPAEKENGRLFYEFLKDSDTNFSVEYVIHNDSLEEINVQINSNDLELTSYLFCDIKDYYANKLPNPIEDQGQVVYNCFEGERKPFVVALSDNSSPTKGKINMVIYKDK
ncbi:MAG: hypothetical protein IPM51_14875 [Sphingobacteriaceae bacterium]|nr:hypothetical protein [Sphingobacteriaceae bacterium]